MALIELQMIPGLKRGKQNPWLVLLYVIVQITLIISNIYYASH